MWPEVLDCLNYCQELLPDNTVVLLSGRESLAIVSHNHLTSTLDLGQKSSHAVVADVAVQDVVFGWFRIRQDWRLHYPMFEVVKCLLFLLFTVARILWGLVDSKAESPLQTPVCTACSTIPDPGMPPTQRGLGEQSTPLQLALSPGW